MTAQWLIGTILRYDVGGRRVLDDVNLSAHAGRLLAVCGPSGAGKSSLLALLGGQELELVNAYSFPVDLNFYGYHGHAGGAPIQWFADHSRGLLDTAAEHVRSVAPDVTFAAPIAPSSRARSEVARMFSSAFFAKSTSVARSAGVMPRTTARAASCARCQ